ncbi:PAS domain-containing protein [Methanoculleus chikugoensis]|uniref:PAS domain-containing protein n=1 Tax=Methanoculleus chikugoensis TaxID=118126 RepID=UPI0006D2A825|nr:PAS domain-containing protein [Methanoculleus chikugoensis]
MALVRTHLAPLIDDVETAGRLLEALRDREPLSGLECRIAPDRWMACSVRVPGDGTALLLVSDISARKKSEQRCRRLEAEQRHYRELFDLAPDGYFVCDPEGTILDVNRAGALLLAKDRRNLIGTPGTDHIAPRGQECLP